MEAEGEGVQEERSTSQLLTKGTLYSLPDNPKVTSSVAPLCPSLSLEKHRTQPPSTAPALKPRGLRPGIG